MDCHFLLQGISPTQGLDLGLPHCRQTLYHWSHQGSPKEATGILYFIVFHRYCIFYELKSCGDAASEASLLVSFFSSIWVSVSHSGSCLNISKFLPSYSSPAKVLHKRLQIITYIPFLHLLTSHYSLHHSNLSFTHPIHQLLQ